MGSEGVAAEVEELLKGREGRGGVDTTRLRMITWIITSSAKEHMQHTSAMHAVASDPHARPATHSSVHIHIIARRWYLALGHVCSFCSHAWHRRAHHEEGHVVRLARHEREGVHGCV